MARNKTSIEEKYNAPFPTALRALMEKRGETQESIAKAAGKTRQTISQYVNGISEPKYDVLVKIADHFDVSTDYLLGRTEDPHRLPCATEELGLSMDAINSITKGDFGESNYALIGLDVLLCEPTFSLVCFRVAEYLKAVQTMTDNPFSPKGIDPYLELRLTEELESKHPELRNVIWVNSGSNYAVQARKEACEFFENTLKSIAGDQELKLIKQSPILRKSK